jgi:AcrR family transcriptional regulator
MLIRREEWMSEPSHWLLRRDAPTRRRLEGRKIVELAHSLLHEEGSAALSMRALAGELGTSTSALYRYVPSKQWLLIAIADHVLADVDTTSATSRGRPRSRLEALSSSYREVLRAHPHLHEVLTSQVTLTPNSMRIAEAALACLRDEGIRDRDLVDAYNAWCGYVIGFSILETKPSEHAPDPSLRKAMRRQLRDADPNSFPILATMMDDVADRAYGLRWQGDRLGDGTSSFGWGLAALLDGFERRAAPRRASKG